MLLGRTGREACRGAIDGVQLSPYGLVSDDLTGSGAVGTCAVGNLIRGQSSTARPTTATARIKIDMSQLKSATSIEGRLFMVAVVVCVCLIGLAILGERTLPLFGGDRSLARRTYLTGYVGAGGVMLSLAVPALATELVRRLRHLFMSVDAKGPVAQVILSEQALGYAQYTGLCLMTLGLCASLVAAALTWTGLMWEGR